MASDLPEMIGEQGQWRKIDPQWSSNITQCAMIDTHCSWWRAETTLTLEDLGLSGLPADERHAMENLLNLGQRYLLPKRIIKELQYWENQQRQNMYRKSMETAQGRVVAQKNYGAWLERAENIRANFNAVVQRIGNEWHELAAEVDTDYRALGTRAYRQASAQEWWPGNSLTEAEWVANFVRKATAKRITAEQWLKEASMTWVKSYIPLQAMIEREMLKQAGLITPDLSNQMARDIEADAAEQLGSGLYKFMADLRSAIANNVLDVVADCIKAFRKNERVLPRNSSKQLKNLVAKIDEMVFWDDKTLAANMANLESILAQRSDLRDANELEQALVNLGTEARMLLVELDRPAVRSTNDIGIPDEPVNLAQMATMSRSAVDLSIGEDALELEVMQRASVDIEADDQLVWRVVL